MKFLIIVLLCLTEPAFAQDTTDPFLPQHDHAAGHDEYKNWASEKAMNCCSDRDCGSISDNDIQETTTGTLIKIFGEWCPVKPEHRVKPTVKSPDWGVAHACVSRVQTPLACDRLLCFMGKGLF